VNPPTLIEEEKVMRDRWMMLALVLAIAGCGTADGLTYVRINPSPRPLHRRAPRDVELYASAPPTRPHADIGLFEVAQGFSRGGPNPVSEMFATLRVAAALRDCDAVVLSGTQSPSRYTPRSIQAVCVVFTDSAGESAARSRPSPPVVGEGAVCGPNAQIEAPSLRRPLSEHVLIDPVGGTESAAEAPLPAMSAVGPDRGCRAPLICQGERCVSPFGES
jgi:hypothetical protein